MGPPHVCTPAPGVPRRKADFSARAPLRASLDFAFLFARTRCSVKRSAAVSTLRTHGARRHLPLQSADLPPHPSPEPSGDRLAQPPRPALLLHGLR